MFLSVVWIARVLKVFHSNWTDGDKDESENEIWTPPSVQQLALACLDDDDSRHLMLLTRNGAALPLLKSILTRPFKVLHGSCFADDFNDFYLLEQVHEVKKAMSSGGVLVLINLEAIYEVSLTFFCGADCAFPGTLRCAQSKIRHSVE